MPLITNNCIFQIYLLQITAIIMISVCLSAGISSQLQRASSRLFGRAQATRGPLWGSETSVWSGQEEPRVREQGMITVLALAD